ncbi:MAG: hypothetical protein ACI8Z5_002389 [Lentimonas sp.]|jgi:hypothetical protein
MINALMLISYQIIYKLKIAHDTELILRIQAAQIESRSVLRRGKSTQTDRIDRKLQQVRVLIDVKKSVQTGTVSVLSSNHANRSDM